MLNRIARWFDNIDSPTIYSPEQCQQLHALAGTQDQAQDRRDMSETEICELCTRLAAGNEVADDAIQLYRQVIRTELVNNYWNGSLMAATVYTACRKYGVPRTMRDIDNAAHVLVDSDRDLTSWRSYNGYEVRSLTYLLGVERTYAQIRNRFNRRYPPVEPAAFSQWYCKELGLEEQVEEFVEVVIRRLEDEDIAGIAPNSIAAGAIYYASMELDLSITRRDIEAVAHCSEKTIGKTRTVVKESIEPATK